MWQKWPYFASRKWRIREFKWLTQDHPAIVQNPPVVATSPSWIILPHGMICCPFETAKLRTSSYLGDSRLLQISLPHSCCPRHASPSFDWNLRAVSHLQVSIFLLSLAYFVCQGGALQSRALKHNKALSYIPSVREDGGRKTREFKASLGYKNCCLKQNVSNNCLVYLTLPTYTK